MPDELRQLADEIRHKARELGFDLLGSAPARPSACRDRLRQWLDAGRHGTMHWMERRFEERADPTVYLPGARSVICVAINYHMPLADSPPGHGRIARYALGDDYHFHVKRRLFMLADWLRNRAPGSRTKVGVDTVPVLERELAALAGIGWIGKNTCVIHTDVGSWLLLGEVITTIALPPDSPATDHCGTCRRCIDACPTGAIVGPYQLDARRCISYLTIEHAGEIDPDLKPQIADWLFGCDICQEVCPYNHAPPTATDPVLRPRFATGSLDVQQVLKWRQADYSKALRNSAIKHVRLPVLQRNARIVAENLQRSN